MTYRQQSYWEIGSYSFATGVFAVIAVLDGIFWAGVLSAAFGLVAIAGIVVEGRDDTKEQS